MRDVWWDEGDAAHIRSRSTRYGEGAIDIEPHWTLEAATDPKRIEREPDPKSWRGDNRIIGHSTTAGFVITIIADADDGSGVTAWKASGPDLRDYQRQKEDQ